MGIHDYERIPDAEVLACEKCGELASHYAECGAICIDCLRKQEGIGVIDNGDGTASFKGPLVGMGF